MNKLDAMQMFVRVAEAGSFSAAARMQGVTPSAISRQVARLEKAMGVALADRGIVQVSMIINVFLLANEVFKEFYSGNLHVASSKYLFLGLHGHHALVPWIWTAVTLD